MELLSWTSLCWLILMTVVYWMLPSPRWRAGWLAFSNAGLLVYYYPGQAGQLVGLALLTYGLGRWLGRSGRGNKPALAGAIVLVSFYLLYSKYTVFLLQVWTQALNSLGRQAAFDWEKIAIPVGISFVTFRWLHYVIDSYTGKRGKEDLLAFLGYSFFWPILTSGPIERWQDFFGQLMEQTGWRWEFLSSGGRRILLGIGKKLLVAAALAPLASTLQKPGVGPLGYWVAANTYTWQLYVDFSGYSDIAVGAGRLFGLRLRENFDWPYLRSNPSQFWKHWHMSLTNWFTTYIFIPLGGSRVPFRRILLNTIIVMLVTGLWHGAGWNFIFWGGLHAVGLITWRLYRRFVTPRLPEKLLDSQFYTGAAVFLTYNFVNLAWIPFTTTFSQAKLVLMTMFGG